MAEILGTGLSGLVGSKFVKLFEDQYHFQNIDISDPQQPVDITDFDQVLRLFSGSSATSVVHLAAFTDVSRAWQERDNKEGLAYRVNVTGTENIVRAAEQTQKHLIHISTAYVFDGEKAEPYTETDQVRPIEWYGQTKAWAEEKVMASSGKWTIFRIDQPFRQDAFAKLDIVHRIMKGLSERTLPPQFTNHTFGPTVIEEFATVIEWAIRTATTGLFHATSGEQWNDFDFAQAVKQATNSTGEIAQGDLFAYLQSVGRPYQKNTALNCEKLRAICPVPHITIQEALALVR